MGEGEGTVVYPGEQRDAAIHVQLTIVRRFQSHARDSMEPLIRIHRGRGLDTGPRVEPVLGVVVLPVRGPVIDRVQGLLMAGESTGHPRSTVVIKSHRRTMTGRSRLMARGPPSTGRRMLSRIIPRRM